jgi:hypothetical protein
MNEEDYDKKDLINAVAFFILLGVFLIPIFLQLGSK